MVVLASLLAIVVLSVGAGELVRMQCARWMRSPLQPSPQPAGGAQLGASVGTGSAV